MKGEEEGLSIVYALAFERFHGFVINSSHTEFINVFN